MILKYFFNKFLGRLWDTPIIPKGKTVGYSFVRSEMSNTIEGRYVKVYPPFSLHNVIIGDFTYVAMNSSIHNCEIGKFCSIGPNFCCGLGIHPINGISTAPMFYSTAKQNGITLCKENKVTESRHSIIGNDVFIGANVTVLDGVSIGDGAVIGAGAIVTTDIPPYAVAVGVPAVIKKYRFDEKTIEGLLKKKWWNKNLHDLAEVEKRFFNPKEYSQE